MNKTSPSRLIGYARVSTVDQRLDLQHDALRGAGCERIFEDHGVSGAAASRPGLDQALAALRSGDQLVVYKLDRLGRSVSHLAQLLKWMEQEGIHFSALTEGISTTTSGGRLVFHVFAAVAEFQRDLIRENTTAGLKAAMARGKKIGPPFRLDEETIAIAHRYVTECGYPCAYVAKLIGVSRITLQRGFKRLGLDWRSRGKEVTA